jgi:hypothetical protein
VSAGRLFRVQRQNPLATMRRIRTRKLFWRRGRAYLPVMLNRQALVAAIRIQATAWRAGACEGAGSRV